MAKADDDAAAACWTVQGWDRRQGGRYLARQASRTGVVLQPEQGAEQRGDRAVVRAVRHWVQRDERVGEAWLLLVQTPQGWKLEGSEESGLAATLYLEGAIEPEWRPEDLPPSAVGRVWAEQSARSQRADLVQSAADLSEAVQAPVFAALPFQRAPDPAHIPLPGDDEALGVALDRLALAVRTPCTTVTSSVAGEGKSTVVGWLGAKWASDGARVLIIDADLRLPRQWRRLGDLEPRPGLVEVVRDGRSLSSAVQPSSIPGLDVLVAGSPVANPEELLGRPDLRGCLAQAAGQYDRVLVDTPPLLVFRDALDLARAASSGCGILAVAECGKTTRRMARETGLRLAQGAPCPVGWVLARDGAPAVDLSVEATHALSARRRVAVGLTSRRLGEEHGRTRWIVLEQGEDGHSLSPVVQADRLTWEALVAPAGERYSSRRS